MSPRLRSRRALRTRPSAPEVLACVLLAFSGAVTSACEDETKGVKEPVTPAVDPAEQAKLDQGKKLIAEANDAFAEKKYDRVRKLLAQAAALGNESQRFEIEEAQEKLDKRQAKLWANEVDDRFKNKDCAGAFKQLAEPLKTLSESEAFTRELRRLVGSDALKCVQDMVDAKMVGQAFVEARRIAQDPQIGIVLGPTATKKLATEIETTVSEALRGQVDVDLRARRWSAAVDRIDVAQKKGDATDEQVEALFGAVREAVLPDLLSLAGKAVGQRDALAALRQIDQTAKLVRWAIAEPGAPVVATGGALPDDLARKRAALAIWVEAQRVRVRPWPKPEVRWAHGKVAVYPAWSIDGPSTRELANGVQVWIVGSSRDRALVTAADPGKDPLPQILDKVVGWVDPGRLIPEDTADWLLPDDQLKGARVWGPLRPPEGMWELGTVAEVNGKDITVQRLADGVSLKLSRQKLRSGRLSPGTRVLTFCVAKEQPAQVVLVPPTGRTAKLKCDGGQEKEEDLASLRSKPELLPPTK
jgi:hypothetical protein